MLFVGDQKVYSSRRGRKRVSPEWAAPAQIRKAGAMGFRLGTRTGALYACSRTLRVSAV